jgi:hypothetical protein
MPSPCRAPAQCAADTRPAIAELADLVRDSGSGGGDGGALGDAPRPDGGGEEPDGGGSVWAIQSPGASPRGAARRSASIDPERRHVCAPPASPAVAPARVPCRWFKAQTLCQYPTCVVVWGCWTLARAGQRSSAAACSAPGARACPPPPPSSSLHPTPHLPAFWRRVPCARPARRAAPTRRPPRAQVSLVAGAGARRLAEARCRAAVQLLLVQASGEIYVAHAPRLPQVGARSNLPVAEEEGSIILALKCAVRRVPAQA